MRAAIRTLIHVAPALLLVAPVVASGVAAAQDREGRPWWAGRLKLSAGFEYSTGDYDEESDTDIWYVPLRARYEFEELGFSDRDQLEFKVTFPLVHIKSPGGVAPGDDGGTVVGGESDGRSSNFGVGDMSFKWSYLYFTRSRYLPRFELSTRIKVPTGDEDKDLGSGEAHYTFALGLWRGIPVREAQRVTPFFDVGYRVADGSRLKNRVLTSVGASYRFNRASSVGFAYDFRSKSTSSASDVHEFSPFASIRFSSRFRISSYVVFGASDSTADYAAGLNFHLYHEIE